MTPKFTKYQFAPREDCGQKYSTVNGIGLYDDAVPLGCAACIVLRCDFFQHLSCLSLAAHNSFYNATVLAALSCQRQGQLTYMHLETQKYYYYLCQRSSCCRVPCRIALTSFTARCTIPVFSEVRSSCGALQHKATIKPLRISTLIREYLGVFIADVGIGGPLPSLLAHTLP